MVNERQAVKAVARFVPWLAPLPSAWLVGRATILYLAFPLPVAIVTALVIEALGLVSVFNWQWFTDWNRRKLKTDPPAAPWQPAALGALYLVLTIGLVVILDVLPWLASYAPVALPLLAMIGTVNLALFAGQEGREAEASKARQERKQARQASKAQASKQAQGKQAGQGKQAAQGKSARQDIISLYASDPYATQAQVAQALGISRQAVGQHLGKLEAEGIIERNGQGIKVHDRGNSKDPAQA